MKYVIEVFEVDVTPTNWTERSAWPHEGFFIGRNENSAYLVSAHSVSYIGMNFEPMLSKYTEPEPVVNTVTKTEYVETGVSEMLLLKAIAAASRGEVLK